MESPFITLFNRPAAGQKGPDSAASGRAGRVIGPPVSLLLIPVLFIGAAISIPWVYIQRRVRRRREKRFTEEMQAVGRHMTWKELELAIANNQGTIIGEYLSSKGPFRLWWTEEDIPAVSPYKCDRKEHVAWFEPEFAPFFEWCYARFTNPQSGIARFVVIPAEEHKKLYEKITRARFVSTCSFHKDVLHAK